MDRKLTIASLPENPVKPEPDPQANLRAAHLAANIEADTRALKMMDIKAASSEAQTKLRKAVREFQRTAFLLYDSMTSLKGPK